jgi:lipid A 4'-phosphatase
MHRRTYFEAIAVLAALIAATALIAGTGLDLKIAELFYVPGEGFSFGDLQPWPFLHVYGALPAFLLAGAGLLALLGSLFKPILVPYRSASLFLLLLLALGPGLLVNVAFKDHWGRPRPRQLIEFGGNQQFSEPWEMKKNHPENNSFPSGEASAAFYLFAPYFVLRKKRTGVARIWLVLGIAYGSITGVARMAQGAHFVSDVMWSGGIVYLTGLISSELFFTDKVGR